MCFAALKTSLHSIHSLTSFQGSIFIFFEGHRSDSQNPIFIRFTKVLVKLFFEALKLFFGHKKTCKKPSGVFPAGENDLYRNHHCLSTDIFIIFKISFVVLLFFRPAAGSLRPLHGMLKSAGQRQQCAHH